MDGNGDEMGKRKVWVVEEGSRRPELPVSCLPVFCVTLTVISVSLFQLPSLSLTFIPPLLLLLWANRLRWPRGCYKVSSGSCWVCRWMSGGGRLLRSLCQGHQLKLGTGCCLPLPWAWGRGVTLHVRGLYFPGIPPEFKQWANSTAWCCISSYS